MSMDTDLVPVGAPEKSLRSASGKSSSRTITDTITGEHEHTVVGYSLIKGIGDGEPIASERFVVGGLEWVLLFYPDGKRSSSEVHTLPIPGHGHIHNVLPVAPPPLLAVGPPAGGALLHRMRAQQEDGAAPEPGPAPPVGPEVGGPPPAGAAGPEMGARANPPPAPGHHGGEQRRRHTQAADPAPGGGAGAGAGAGAPRGGGEEGGGRPNGGQQAPRDARLLAYLAAQQQHAGGTGGPGGAAPARMHRGHEFAGVHGGGEGGGSSGAEYCALFVALIGELEGSQGVMNTNEGRVVRAFHRFQLVDQLSAGQDVVKGRRREQGAVKISCSRADPSARNCHGYRKFVKRAVLEDPERGLLVNDTLVIRYKIELVVSSGGALSRGGALAGPAPLFGAGRGGAAAIAIPPQSLGDDLRSLLRSGAGADVFFNVEEHSFAAHRIVLAARSPVFRAMLEGPMKESSGEVDVQGVRPPVFKALLAFVYADELPNALAGSKLDVAMAQHLLAAADRFALPRLRAMCERRLCETVEVETVATTLALAEQNNAADLKRVCLEYVARHLHDVMASEGYAYMVEVCPQLQAELLAVIAEGGGRVRVDLARPAQTRLLEDSNGDAVARRVRSRREA